MKKYGIRVDEAFYVDRRTIDVEKYHDLHPKVIVKRFDAREAREPHDALTQRQCRLDQFPPILQGKGNVLGEPATWPPLYKLHIRLPGEPRTLEVKGSYAWAVTVGDVFREICEFYIQPLEGAEPSQHQPKRIEKLGRETAFAKLRKTSYGDVWKLRVTA